LYGIYLAGNAGIVLTSSRRCSKITGMIRTAHTPIFKFSGAILRFFARQGRHAVTDWVKFHPIGAGVGSCASKTEHFTEFRNINAPTGTYPLRDFYEISEFLRSFSTS